MANFTGKGNYTNKLNQALSATPAGIAEFLEALNIFLSITATLANTLILIALKNVSSIHPPTKLFFRCLAVTDLCVGLLVQPIYATYIMSSILNMNVSVLYYVHEVYVASSYILCGVSALTSTAVSVDRLLALLLGLRYRHAVTLRRVRVIISCLWAMAALGGWLRIWKEDIAIKAASVVLALCLLTSIFCYTRIHLTLRRQQAQIQFNVVYGQQNGQGIPLNIAKYKRTVSSIMWVQMASVVCYVPWIITVAPYTTKNVVALKVTSTLILSNSSLNPILYCWKIREVKQAAVKGTIRRFYCFSKDELHTSTWVQSI